MDERVEVFVADRRQLHQPHPLVDLSGIGDVMRPAIDGHLMAARRQFGVQALREAVVAVSE